MSGYAIGHSFLAISPSLLIGFEKQLPAEFNIYISTSDRMDEMNFWNPIILSGFEVLPFLLWLCPHW